MPRPSRYSTILTLATAMTLSCAVPAFADQPEVPHGVRGLATQTYAGATFTTVATENPPVAVSPTRNNEAWLLEKKADGNEYTIQHVGAVAGPAISVPTASSSTYIHTLQAVDDSTVWLSTATTLYRWASGTWSTVAVPDYQGVAAAQVGPLARDPHGAIHATVTYRKTDPEQQVDVTYRMEAGGWVALGSPAWASRPAPWVSIPQTYRLHFEGDTLFADSRMTAWNNTDTTASWYRFGVWSRAYSIGSSGPGGGFSKKMAILPQRPSMAVSFSATWFNKTNTCLVHDLNVDGSGTACPAAAWYGDAVALDDERIVTTGSREEADGRQVIGAAIRKTPTAADQNVGGAACGGNLSRAPHSLTVWCVSNYPAPGFVARATFPKK